MNYNGPWEIAKIVLMADFVGKKKKKNGPKSRGPVAKKLIRQKIFVKSLQLWSNI